LCRKCQPNRISAAASRHLVKQRHFKASRKHAHDLFWGRRACALWGCGSLRRDSRRVLFYTRYAVSAPERSSVDLAPSNCPPPSTRARKSARRRGEARRTLPPRQHDVFDPIFHAAIPEASEGRAKHEVSALPEGTQGGTLERDRVDRDRTNSMTKLEGDDVAIIREKGQR
jgi:hypothetical protein